MRSRLSILLAAISVLALTLLWMMGPVMANPLHQGLTSPPETPISWDDPAFAGSAEDCDEAALEPGDVLWHFVHTNTDGGNLPATLTATFTTAGEVNEDGYSLGGGNAIVMYDVITGHDILEGAYDSIENDGLLNLSHICVGEEASESESASPSESESQSEEQSVSEEQSASATPTPEESVEAGTGTPAQSLPDNAMPFLGGNPLPTVAFGLMLLTSLAGLAFANVKSARNRS